MPQNGAKRLTNGRFLDPINHLENRGRWLMVKNENSNMSKIKDEAPNKWAFQPPNNRPSEKASEYVQKMTQNALKMADFSTQSDI